MSGPLLDDLSKNRVVIVDGSRNPANHLMLVLYPIIHRVLYIPGGCLGFLPSTVSLCLFSWWLFTDSIPCDSSP